MKNSFILYNSYSEQINLLDDAECGRLFKALFAFNASGEKPSLSGGAMMAFSFITSQMQRDAEEYEKVCERRREAGKRGGRPPKANGFSEEAKKANGFFEKQTKAKKPDDDTDDVDVDVDVDDEDIIKSTSYSSSETHLKKREIQKIIDAWNTLGSLGIKQIQRMDSESKRAKNLNARISEYGTGKILEAIENVRHSDFLQGRSRSSNGWVITFDWFVLPNNFPKVLEGNYSNREPQREQSSNPFLDYLREEGQYEHNGNG